MVAAHMDTARVVFDGGGIEVRRQDIGGSLTAGFVTMPVGTDLSKDLVELPDDGCPCPHGGHLLSGRSQVHTANGTEIYSASVAFSWPPGHAPVAVADTTYSDVAPTDGLDPVLQHLTRS